MIRLGPLELPNPYILAPMAGVSEMPYREIALEHGAGLAPTELVSANGLIRASARTAKYLRKGPSEKPFMVQIFGGEPEIMAQGALIAKEAGADIIDINMGCPVPKVTRSGAGSGLLVHPERAAAVVRACKEATGLPVSAKIRAGWDSKSLNFREMGQALEEAGVAFIALHARTRAQGYSGKADWTQIAALKQSLRHTPVVGNGDVGSREDALRMVAETGCDAVMIGRAALGNPWIFRDLAGGPPPTPTERAALIRRHFKAHLDFVGNEVSAVRQFRKHLSWYSHGLTQASVFRSKANAVETIEDVFRTIDDYFSTADSSVRYRAVDEADVDYRTAYG